jgi:hypothetical protein
MLVRVRDGGRRSNEDEGRKQRKNRSESSHVRACSMFLVGVQMPRCRVSS